MLNLLVSYPKSGNTWVRALLTNYLSGSDTPARLDALIGRSTLSDRQRFDEEMGVDSALLTVDEIDRLRPDYCRAISAASARPALEKVHTSYARNTLGQPLFPGDAIGRVIYIVRNPLAVCVSYVHHQGMTVDQVIDRMGNDSLAMYGDTERLYTQLHQHLGSWSSHVTGWIDQTELDVVLVTYEALHRDPAGALRRMLGALGQPVDERRLRFAVGASAFATLRQMEERDGFSEKNPQTRWFFRAGRLDDWKLALSAAQVSRVKKDHGAVMARLGYA